MDRRNFMTAAIFGTVATATAVAGKAIAGDSFDPQNSIPLAPLTPEEEAVIVELREVRMLKIPSRKSFLSTEETRRKGRILKRLVHKNRVCIDFYTAEPGDELNATCLVYYLPSEGKTPLEYYD